MSPSNQLGRRGGTAGVPPRRHAFLLDFERAEIAAGQPAPRGAGPARIVPVHATRVCQVP